MSSFRDRFLTPKVARAITSPSAIVATGAGVAAGVLIGLNPIGAVVVGLGAFAVRVLAAVPRAPQRPGINPRALEDPWRTVMQEILDASHRFDTALGGVRQGPLRERLGQIGDRLETAVDEAWRIASAGQALSTGRRQIDGGRIVAELHAAESAPKTERSDRTIAAIRSQLASAERLDRTINDTYDQLRLLDARIDETVTRTVELSVTQSDADAVGGLGDEVESIVGDMEALRQAVEETRHASGPPTMPESRPAPSVTDTEPGQGGTPQPGSGSA
ncbi:MAG: hypothetical protein M3Y51_08545 [Actinomycetota bacterium]|nr:hypothetical protein [Actinomycetota bacterium]